LEWYDFSVYAFFGVYIARNFFHRGNTGTEMVEAFMAFGICFIARPLGALADRVDREREARDHALKMSILVKATRTRG
ncbi:MFS transporter, partial [Burkholderia pseudomallei]